MLDEFYNRVREKYSGSLVRTRTTRTLDENAKEYLNRLAKEGSVEKVAWGWYYIGDDAKDVWKFLENDKNFKVVIGQSAASFWNHAFVHRDVVTLYVKDRSYGKALERFSKKKGWKVETYYSGDVQEYVKVGKLNVQKLEENIIDCASKWAFVDAFATIYENRRRIDLEKIAKDYYWNRLPGSDTRIGQVLGYAFRKFNDALKKEVFPSYRTRLPDKFVRRTIDEAIEKVIEFA
jgi:hypothetical protein